MSLKTKLRLPVLNLQSRCPSGTQLSSPNIRVRLCCRFRCGSLQIKVQFCRVLVPGGWDDAPKAAFISSLSLIGHMRLLFFHWLAAEAAVDRGVWLDRRTRIRWVWLFVCEFTETLFKHHVQTSFHTLVSLNSWKLVFSVIYRLSMKKEQNESL